METTCTRCHQPVPEQSCFCPACGLPQLVYSSEDETAQAQPDVRAVAIRDASSINWKPAIRAASILAVPAGLIASGISPVGVLGLLWMAASAAWAVSLYVRRQGPAWITMGAGARIGLITGLMAAWLAFSVTGGALFVQRYVFHKAGQIDSEWQQRVEMSQAMAQQWAEGVGAGDAAQARAMRGQVEKWMLTPWGHAGIEAFGFATNSLLLLFFAAGGGAVGARWMARSRRTGL
ncbi:MAG TPA: zinc ribbon domain-containing protein [Terracidiphilus sp.]|nr:zinc ribbon domain-containing protein [Terracidiphilus sp.]